MYRILLVDDESVVREGIRDNMNWSELGFELVGDCADGSEAMEMVEKLAPDVVLTDICMPFVDGLQLTRYISDKFPCTKVIILTGYDEFEYAQQAVKLNAYDFLLKPVTAGELRKILGRVKYDLDEQAKRVENLKKLEAQLHESLPLLKERFLNNLISGRFRDREITDKLKYFNINLSGSYYMVMAIDIDDHSEMEVFSPGTEEELLLFAVYNICEELVSQQGCGIVFQSRNDKIIAVLSSDNEYGLRQYAQKLSEEIRQPVEKYLKFTVTIGLGITCSKPEDLRQSYESAVSALDYRFVLGKNKVIDINDVEHNTKKYYFDKIKWSKSLASVIKVGTAAQIDETIDEIIKELKSVLVPVESCYVHIQQIISSIMNTIDELGLSEREVYGEQSPFTEVYRFKTLDEIEVWLKQLCKKTADYILDRRSDSSKLQVKEAEEYIRQNYNSEDISLNSICSHLFISTSYFSLIFKNHTGETFIEYLTRVRVDKAMELLKATSLRTYEISNRVGYGDAHYFSMVFKKATGLTPTEYRERVLKEN